MIKESEHIKIASIEDHTFQNTQNDIFKETNGTEVKKHNRVGLKNRKQKKD